MAAKKHTYIFKITDPGLFGLDRLVERLRDREFISWKYETFSGVLATVQVFTDERTMYELAYAACFGPTHIVQRVVKQARRNGDLAVGKASKRLDDLRRAANVRAVDSLRPVKLTYDRDDTARLNWLEAHDAGLNRPNSQGGLAHVWVDGDHYYARTYREAIDRAMAVKPKEVSHISDEQFLKNISLRGGVLVTKRSKRSA